MVAAKFDGLETASVWAVTVGMLSEATARCSSGHRAGAAVGLERLGLGRLLAQPPDLGLQLLVLLLSEP